MAIRIYLIAGIASMLLLLSFYFMIGGDDSPRLSLELQLAQHRFDKVENMSGWLKMTNNGDNDLLFISSGDPLQNLDFHIFDSKGNKLEHTRYGRIYDQYSQEEVRHVFPRGKSMTVSISLTAPLRNAKAGPGRYDVYAVFECQAIRSISNKVQISVGIPKRNLP